MKNCWTAEPRNPSRPETDAAVSRQHCRAWGALGVPDGRDRIAALETLARTIREGCRTLPPFGKDVNNHIHTIYSFSPYSPTEAVWHARGAGLRSAGLMDHDSIAGAEEFIDAGRILGVATTVGVECRGDFSGTRLAGRWINNPDQAGLGYMAMHGIPHPEFERVAAFFAPRIEARHNRNRRMTARLCEVLPSQDMAIDYEADVLPLSRAKEGGTVTERHILFALARRLCTISETGQDLAGLLVNKMGLGVSEKDRAVFSDTKNTWIAYDLLAFLKRELLPRFYVPAGEECPPAAEAVAFAREIGAIPAYAYLGDVVASGTGDKPDRAFEDGYLDLLFEELVGLGFQAVTYMPSRNSPAQLDRVRRLCHEHKLLQISGEDINSPRQSFVCEAQRAPEFAHLNEATWALIGHEREASRDPACGFFSPDVCAAHPDLDERVSVFARRAGRGRECVGA